MPDIVIAAAEPSGDMLAAQLIRAVCQARPDIRFSGIGGRQMRAAGCECMADIADLSVMGYVDAARKLPRILPLRAKLIADIARRKPAMFIGVDAPDFNLSVAAQARKSGIMTIQYGSPSIWMWRRGRIGKIARAVGRVWCLFPFEAEYYKNAPVAAAFVGHPLADKQQPNRESVRRQLGINDDAEVIAILPGSREQELNQHLPLAARVVEMLKKDKRVFVAAAATAAAGRQMAAALPGCIIAPCAADALVSADIAAVKSGTVALEAAVIGTPMVVFYRPSNMAQLAMRWRRFYLPFFSLPNILANRFVVPEMIGTSEARADSIAAEVQKLSQQPHRREQMRAAFDIMRRSLMSDNSAAAEVIAILDGNDKK